MGVLEQLLLWPDALPDANPPLFPGLGTGSVVCWIAHTKAEVWPRITKFFMNLYTHWVYNHAGYDVTICFRSEVVDVRKRTENDASNGFSLESPKMARTSIPTS